jgi:hypothetical protein
MNVAERSVKTLCEVMLKLHLPLPARAGQSARGQNPAAGRGSACTSKRWDAGRAAADGAGRAGASRAVLVHGLGGPGRAGMLTRAG